MPCGQQAKRETNIYISFNRVVRCCFLEFSVTTLKTSNRNRNSYSTIKKILYKLKKSQVLLLESQSFTEKQTLHPIYI